MVRSAVGGSVVALLCAFFHKSRVAAFLGSLLAAPMFLYLSATPRFRWTAPVAYGLLVLMAWRRGKLRWWIMCLLALPAAGILAWLVYAVMTQ